MAGTVCFSYRCHGSDGLWITSCFYMMEGNGRKLLGENLPNKGFFLFLMPHPLTLHGSHTLNTCAQDQSCLLTCSLPWLPSAHKVKARSLGLAVRCLLSGFLSCALSSCL